MISRTLAEKVTLGITRVVRHDFTATTMTGKPEPTDETLALGGPPGVDQPNLLLDWAIWAFLYPLQLALRALGLVFDLVRPYAPQLVPLVFCLLLLPVLAFFSLSAGFVVWKTSAVSWEYPVLLQYGHVPSSRVNDEVIPLMLVLIATVYHHTQT